MNKIKKSLPILVLLVLSSCAKENIILTEATGTYSSYEISSHDLDDNPISYNKFYRNSEIKKDGNNLELYINGVFHARFDKIKLYSDATAFAIAKQKDCDGITIEGKKDIEKNRSLYDGVYLNDENLLILDIWVYDDDMTTKIGSEVFVFYK